MRRLKQAINFKSTGDKSRGPTQSKGEASVPAEISEQFTRTPHKSRTERLKALRSQCATDLEYEVESSQEHWTEVETEAASDDEQLELANREVFERLMEQWRCPRTGLCFFRDWGENLQVGRKITEGGQAEIFEAEIEGDPAYVVKVFKKEYSLKDLERQWPRGMFQPQPFANSRSSIAGRLLTYREELILEAMGQYPEAGGSAYTTNYASFSTHFIFNNCCFIHGATLLRNGRFAFVLERYWGDLRRFIDLQMEAGYRKPLPDVVAEYYIMLEIAKGMQTLHSRGILHRDLKASNILVRNTNGDLDRFSLLNSSNIRDVTNVDVADFESSSSVVGTGFWRAPEVLLALKYRNSMLDSTPWTEKSDVYAYGMTCYEVLTGRVPFEGVEGINIDRVINGERPPWLESRVNFYLKDLVEDCWRANPLERPNFQEIVEVLVCGRASHGEKQISDPGRAAGKRIVAKER